MELIQCVNVGTLNAYMRCVCVRAGPCTHNNLHSSHGSSPVRCGDRSHRALRPEIWLPAQALRENSTLACTCSAPAQALRATNNLLAKYGSERRWLSLLLSANKDKARFETLHQQLEACVRHVTDMVALKQVGWAVRVAVGGRHTHGTDFKLLAHFHWSALC